MKFKRKRTLLFVILIILTLILLIYYLFHKNNKKEQIQIPAEIKIEKKYGISIDAWIIITDTVKKGDYLGTILNKYGISPQKIDKIAKMSTDTFNTTLISVGRIYTIFADTIIDSIPQAKIFVYENNKIKYTFYDFRQPDTIIIQKLIKPVDTVIKTATGTIRKSLWHTINKNGYTWDLALALTKVFGWSVDFYALQVGDWFKVIYEELIVDNEKVGFGKIKAGVFCQSGKEFWAIPFMQDSVINYYDTLGNNLRKTFMTAPLEYTSVSSRYTHARMHPIFHKVSEHLAVDFTAPYGTPVYAASDGVIETRTFNEGAGYYIVIRHNSVYKTVYMHLSKFGNYNVGNHVSQGDIIGYVGSTGWSTGPHLHYEIHENGRKIDPLSFKPPPAEPVDSAHMRRFNKEKRKWIKELQKIKVEDKRD